MILILIKCGPWAIHCCTRGGRFLQRRVFLLLYSTTVVAPRSSSEPSKANMTHTHTQHVLAAGVISVDLPSRSPSGETQPLPRTPHDITNTNTSNQVW